MSKLSSYTSAENFTCTYTSKENGNQAVVCFKYIDFGAKNKFQIQFMLKSKKADAGKSTVFLKLEKELIKCE